MYYNSPWLNMRHGIMVHAHVTRVGKKRILLLLLFILAEAELQIVQKAQHIQHYFWEIFCPIYHIVCFENWSLQFPAPIKLFDFLGMYAWNDKAWGLHGEQGAWASSWGLKG